MTSSATHLLVLVDNIGMVREVHQAVGLAAVWEHCHMSVQPPPAQPRKKLLHCTQGENYRTKKED
jgi:hypothetical protein